MFTQFRNLFIAAFLFLSAIQGFAQQRESILQSIISQVNSDSLIYFVKELSGVVPTIIGGQSYTITSRNKSYPGNDKATEYLQQKLNSYGMQTTIQSFSATGKNMIGVQRGTTFPNQKYMICAHMDCMPSSTTAPGADDNASGTAAVIEAARVLRQYSFPFTIVYALWDEEEQGLVGSAYYANAAATAGDSILGVVNLDMVSWERNGDNKVNIHSRAVGSSLDISTKMFEINTAYGIGLLTNLKNPGITGSDHASFWTKNYGAVLLIEDDDNDFNAYYHTANDRVTEFNIPFFKKCSQLAIATLASFALNLNIQISHTPQASLVTNDKLTLYVSVQSGLSIGTALNAPRLYYRTNQGSGYSSFRSEAGVQVSPGMYQFGLPKIPVGSAVQYYFAVQDSGSGIVVTSPKGGGGFNPPGSTPPGTFHQFYIAPQIIKLSDNASSVSRWTASGGPWNITTSKFVSAPSSFTDSPSGTYSSSVTSTFTYNNDISITSCLGAVLEFDTQFDLEDKYDYVQVQISTNNGSTWVPLTGMYTKPGSGTFQPTGEPLYNGVQAAWVHEKMDLVQYTGRTFKLRFFFKSDGSVTRDGIYIDDILLSTYSLIAYECYLYPPKSLPDGTIELTWTSVGSSRAASFEILRSETGDDWTTIASLNVNGGEDAAKTFSYIDRSVTRSIHYYRVRQMQKDGSAIVSSVNVGETALPRRYALSQNYPNPFNPSTRINYSLEKSGFVDLKLYNAVGECIQQVERGFKDAGNYQTAIDGTALAAGMYIIELRVNEYRAVKKIVLLK